MSELVLAPTSVSTEGTGSSHTPYVVATDLSGGASATAWIDDSDASYAKSDAGRSSKGTYPNWAAVDPSLTGVTAIGIRFRAMTPSTDPVGNFVVQLFGQVSKLLSNPFHGSVAPLAFTAEDTWQDFDYVIADAEYDEGGWAPDGVVSALAQSFIYARTLPTDSTAEFTADGVVYTAEQRIILYYGAEVLPCDTDVALDLSTAVFNLNDGGSAGGQYVDGVIATVSGGLPEYWFDFALDPTKRCRVTVEFDPLSAHDGDGDPLTSDRFVLLRDALPGDENSGDNVQIGDGFSNTADVCVLTIGPGRGNWDDPDLGVPQGYTRLLFQTSQSGAVSAITIRKLCKTRVPWQRLTNRDTLRLTADRSREGNRLTGYL